jgi:hypothetical protein
MDFVPCTPGGISSWRQRTALDGRDYTLAFRWNQRDGHWYLDLATSLGVAIRSGMMLATSIPLLAGLTTTARPPGELVIVDTTGAVDLDPGFADLGSRFVLAYFTAAELGR